jgi:peptidoglycan/xylan/chitin deacetylase (PgdA/CDA1 family)
MGKDVKRLVVLMYHALYSNADELESIDLEDRPYAVSTANFRDQLTAIAKAGIPILDPADLDKPTHSNYGALITFDDGHGSNYQHAYPALQERGHKALFFVTTDFIGRRPGFCSWSQLREMSTHNMMIASHGRTHRFLNDLSEADAREELASSKEAIQQATGSAVTHISFPGGRYTRRELAAGAQLGYRVFHSSRIGTQGPSPLSKGNKGAVLKRLAIRNQTSVAECAAMARADPAWLVRAHGLAAAKGALRSLLGNQAYHNLYQRFHRAGDA